MRFAVHVLSAPSPIVLAATLLPLLGANPASTPAMQRVPTVEEVVEREGFTPTPSQSEIYRPGVVLVPNAKGGHDVIVDDCVEVAPRTSAMAQSSIALSLAGGVSARLGVAKGAAAAGIERRLSFVDPEQRTIPLAQVAATAACEAGVKNAARFADLSQGVLVYDVLVAQIKNSVCTKSDASGRVVALAAAEAAEYSECVQESQVQVPLGYKAVPLRQLLTAGAAPTPEPGPARGAASAGAGGFGAANDLARQIEAAEKLKVQVDASLSSCIKAEGDKVRAQASADWVQLAPLASKSDPTAKAAGREYFEKFLLVYGGATIRCQNDLGDRIEAVSVPELALARAWLDAPAVGAGSRTVGRSGYALRLVPGGIFEVGCRPSVSVGCSDPKARRALVTLSRPVLVGETEVTQGLYQRLMGTNPSAFSSCGAGCPVEQVSWLEAVQLANRLSAAEGLEQCYLISGKSVRWTSGVACLGYRLRTESEWEVAARGGQETVYSGGDELSLVGWFDGNSGETTHPAAEKRQNAYGLYDMSGNVWEWVWDWFDSDAYPGGAAVDPAGPSSGSSRVYRGGGWGADAQRARVDFRNHLNPGDRHYGLGVRLVRTAP